MKKINFKINGIDGPTTVEIYRNGEVLVPADVLEYEQSMAEFGEEPSDLMKFIDRYEGSPIFTLLNWVLFKGRPAAEHAARGPNEFTAALLMIDYAERIIPILEHFYPPEKYGHAYREMLLLVKELINKEIEFWRRGEPWVGSAECKEAMDFIQNQVEHLPDDVEYYQIESFVKEKISPAKTDALQAMSSAMGIRHKADASMVSNGSISARYAVGRFAEYTKGKIGNRHILNQATEREKNWQIRRFFDVVWAIRNNKPWPSLKSTR